MVATEPGIFADGPAANDAFDGSRDWWPAELGRPSSAGAQNGARYAYFATARRLAIDAGAGVVVYDTLDHRISGAAQQQSASSALTLSSQHGDIDVATLPVVSGAGQATRTSATSSPKEPGSSPPHDTLATIEKLADLRAKGILDEAQFATKKAELLRRI